MRGRYLLIFIVCLPTLAVIGHDVMMYYFHQDKGFMFSTPGYLWTHYQLDSYKWVVQNASPDVWAIIDYILAQKAIIVAAAFAGFFGLIFLLINIAATRHEERESRRGNFRYKRR
jgi:hypothetical protein